MRMMVFPGTFVGLAVLALLIAGVVLLFVKLGAKAFWIVGPVALVGVFVVMWGLWHLAMPMSVKRYETSVSELRPADYPADAGAPDGRSPTRLTRPVSSSRERNSWKVAATPVLGSDDGVSSAFLADVYPSAHQAAEALALDVARSFHEALHGAGSGDVPLDQPDRPVRPVRPASTLPDIRVTGQGDTAVLEIVAQALRREALARSVSIAAAGSTTRPASAPAEQVLCAVRVDGEDSGTVQIVLQAPGRQVSRSTRFVAKPWAANFAQFAAASGEPVVRAASGAVASFEQAQREAFAEASRQLAPYVSSAMKPSAGNDGQAVLHGIFAELLKGNLIIDRFGQRFNRPYGNLWRQQVLIDASPRTVMPLARAIENEVSNERLAARQTLWSIFASLGGVAVLIFAVYLVLNGATKGYYTRVLRVLAVAAVAVAVAVVTVLLLQGNDFVGL